MNEQILIKLGFTEGEIKVYLALLELGNVTSGPIVDKSGISKSKVYEILDRLTKKGVVSQIIEDKIKHFQAANPNKLLEMYEEKEVELDQLKNQLTSILPSLESKYSSIKEKQEVTVFRGYQGIKSIFNDILNDLGEGDEYIVFSAVETPEYLKGYIEDFSNKRAKKKAKLKIIYDSKFPKKEIDIIKKQKYAEARINFPEFSTPAVFNLYKNKTAIILWSEKPIGILIEDSEVTKSFMHYFKFLWKITKKS